MLSFSLGTCGFIDRILTRSLPPAFLTKCCTFHFAVVVWGVVTLGFLKLHLFSAEKSGLYLQFFASCLVKKPREWKWRHYRKRNRGGAMKSLGYQKENFSKRGQNWVFHPISTWFKHSQHHLGKKCFFTSYIFQIRSWRISSSY